MKSRTSFFNPTVFHKDLTRFAPVWVLYAVGGGFVLLQSTLLTFFAANQFSVTVASSMQALSIFNLFYALTCALLLFGDLFKGRLANALHAMPLRRECWFFTHFIAGLCFSVIPNLAFALLITVLCGYYWYLGLIWFAAMFLQYLFFFSLAVFAVMCTGKKFAATAVYLILNFLSYIILWLFSTFYEPLLTGIVIDTDIFALFCPVICLIQYPVLLYRVDYSQSLTALHITGFGNGWVYLWIIGGVSLLFIVLALLLYRKRKLESAGDFVSVRPFVPVFALIYTLSVTAMLQLTIGSLSMLLPINLAIGYFTGQMLLQRRVNVFQKRTFIGYGILAGVLVVSTLLTWLDPLGITRWTPRPEQVSSVTVSDEYYFSSDIDSSYYASNSLTVSDPERISALVDLHETVLQDVATPGLTSFLDDTDAKCVYLIYTMDSGRQVHRRYEIPADSPSAAKAKDFFLSPEFVLGYQDWNTFLSQVTEIEVEYATVRSGNLSGLLDAMKSDCELGRMGDWADGEYRSYALISIGEQTHYVTIRDNCLYTISWLNKNIPGWDSY